MLLPPGRVIFERTENRKINFDTLLANEFITTVNAADRTTGFLCFEYQEFSDVIMVYQGQFRVGLRFKRDNSREQLNADEIIRHAKENGGGIVAYYYSPPTYLEMLWDSTNSKPLQSNLSPKLISWDSYQSHLKGEGFSGYLEITTGEYLAYLRYEEGELIEEFYDEPPSMSKKCRFRRFASPVPYFLSEKKQIQITFLDIFRDLLMTTYSLLVQREDVQHILDDSLAKAREKFPEELAGVKNLSSGVIDFDHLVNNLDRTAGESVRKIFFESVIEILYHRINAIEHYFGGEYVERVLKEMKLVQLYHQKALRNYGAGEMLISLWKRFE